ncbi:hypothetical protein LTR64_001870 [Lithohypha guttulata]|uniref:uncharacterized protein n=1 Tax=Lithohypha guttulata TaxID=1690604 RepID=UPI002DE03A25|nr:hypothetical protein LTR51_007729 [Lithohypha guttulata]
MSSDASDEATISYPSIAIVIGLAYLLYRYFTSSSSNGSDPSSSQSRNGLRFTQAQVDQVANMFPQLSRRDIMWDLQRNRGSVNATVERVLGGRSLDPAPPSFQPPMPETASQSTSTSSISSLLSGKQQVHPDLITRYKLQDRINSSDKGKGVDTSGSASSNSWGATKDERQSALKRRRDEMILEARRKMLERDATRGERTAQ